MAPWVSNGHVILEGQGRGTDDELQC